MTYETAFDLVRRKRACIKPNSGFVKCVRRSFPHSPLTRRHTGRCKSGRRSGETSARTPARLCAEPRRPRASARSPPIQHIFLVLALAPTFPLPPTPARFRNLLRYLSVQGNRLSSGSRVIAAHTCIPTHCTFVALAYLYLAPAPRKENYVQVDRSACGPALPPRHATLRRPLYHTPYRYTRSVHPTYLLPDDSCARRGCVVAVPVTRSAGRRSRRAARTRRVGVISRRGIARPVPRVPGPDRHVPRTNDRTVRDALYLRDGLRGKASALHQVERRRTRRLARDLS